MADVDRFNLLDSIKEEEKERAAEKERKKLEDVAAKRARLTVSADGDRDDTSSTDTPDSTD